MDMDKEYFVERHSVVRQIWGKRDTILFIFAGASAEFALSKAVGWLYFTGRLPSDPMGRLFSTVAYAKTIVFAEKQTALHTIDSIATIHASVEAKRSATIPEWAYRNMLFMLIDYSIRSFELLERRLNNVEKEEVLQVFNRLGIRMGISGLPSTYEQWEKMRHADLAQSLQQSNYTNDLFSQYKKQLGKVRYRILLEAQALVVPRKVSELLGFRKVSLLYPLLVLYKISKIMKVDWFIRDLILPSKYKKEIKDLDS